MGLKYGQIEIELLNKLEQDGYILLKQKKRCYYNSQIKSLNLKGHRIKIFRHRKRKEKVNPDKFKVIYLVEKEKEAAKFMIDNFPGTNWKKRFSILTVQILKKYRVVKNKKTERIEKITKVSNMTKKNKLLVGIDNDIYNDFVNVCRKEGTTIVDKLEQMMSIEIKKSIYI